MDTIGQWVYDFAEYAVSLLPDSPFAFLQTMGNSPVQQWLGYLNWFIPIGTIVAIMTTWCAAILIYYVVQILLRWVKAVE